MNASRTRWGDSRRRRQTFPNSRSKVSCRFMYPPPQSFFHVASHLVELEINNYQLPRSAFWLERYLITRDRLVQNSCFIQCITICKVPLSPLCGARELLALSTWDQMNALFNVCWKFDKEVCVKGEFAQWSFCTNNIFWISTIPGMLCSDVIWDRRSWDKTGLRPIKSVLVLVLHTAILVLFCDARSCNARRNSHNDLEGHNNF